VDLLVHSELNSVWLFFIPCFVVRMRNLYDYGYDVKHLLGCAPYCCPQALSPASCKMAGSKSAGVCVCVFLGVVCMSSVGGSSADFWLKAQVT
jgi:hypothetical protein